MCSPHLCCIQEHSRLSFVQEATLQSVSPLNQVLKTRGPCQPFDQLRSASQTEAPPATKPYTSNRADNCVDFRPFVPNPSQPILQQPGPKCSQNKMFSNGITLVWKRNSKVNSNKGFDCSTMRFQFLGVASQIC